MDRVPWRRTATTEEGGSNNPKQKNLDSVAFGILVREIQIRNPSLSTKGLGSLNTPRPQEGNAQAHIARNPQYELILWMLGFFLQNGESRHILQHAETSLRFNLPHRPVLSGCLLPYAKNIALAIRPAVMSGHETLPETLDHHSCINPK